MKHETTEFSFLLKPCQYGIGVFAVHDIAEGTYLRLFGERYDKQEEDRKKADVPEELRFYCIDRGDILRCPRDFGRMELGWYINHSQTPNAVHKEYDYYALRDINAGEEITTDYGLFEEPEEAREEYYK